MARRTKFSRGDAVEARFKGKSKWYSGTVTLVHSDGTYQVSCE